METIKVIAANSDKEFDTLFWIRQKVFVEEQQVDPEIEYDEFEETSNHYLGLIDGIPAGTARWRKTPNGVKLERFAVLPEYRGKGIASALIRHILNDLPDYSNVYLHSQIQVSGLYARFGFERVGQMFQEANIDHYKMILRRNSE